MRLFFIILLLCSPIGCFAQFRASDPGDLNRSETQLALKEHVEYLSSAMLEGRAAGSEGELEAARYVSTVLESYGVDLLSGRDGELFGVLNPQGDTLKSHNVIGFIPGCDPELKDRFIVIGARLDNLGSMDYEQNGEARHRIYYGANGNASGLAIMMELARKLTINGLQLKRSVIVAAFGASEISQAGSWYFLNRSFEGVADIDAMVNLDMLGTASGGFYAYTSSNPDLNDLITSLYGTLQPIKPKIVSLEPVASDHRSFYGADIPSVLFTTGMYPEYNSERDTASIIEYDDMERELEYLFNFCIELAGAPKPEFRRTDASAHSSGFGSEVVPYSDCDIKPAFLGSSDPAAFLREWVYVYLRYPEEAVEAGIQGRVLVSMVIDEKGNVTNVQVEKGVSPLLDKEAVRVVSASPRWKPAQLRGKKVKCGMSMYVEFKLERK